MHSISICFDLVSSAWIFLYKRETKNVKKYNMLDKVEWDKFLLAESITLVTIYGHRFNRWFYFIFWFSKFEFLSKYKTKNRVIKQSLFSSEILLETMNLCVLKLDASRYF